MKKPFCLLLLLALLLPPLMSAGAAYQDGVYQDLAPGYNDDVIITVTVRNGKIVAFDAKNRNGNESEYFEKAREGIGAAVMEKQGLDGVEAVSGATGSSQSMLEAMKGLLEQLSGPEAAASGNAPSASPAHSPAPTADSSAAEVFSGLGSAANFRVGPGKDAQGTPVYSFNIAMADALFDREGRILNVRVDVYEISTPNYDGDSMPHFSSWPGKEGYPVYDSASGKLTDAGQNTEENAAQEISQWVTKRERGDRYGMNPQNEWYRQMDAYQQWMLGRTPAQLREWFDRCARPSTGRPIDPSSDHEEEYEPTRRVR